jgi:hypothetical protein
VSSDIQPGDVVVCVDDRVSPGSPVVNVRKGRIYRVSALGPTLPHDMYGHARSVFLVAVVARAPTGAFAEPRFRKLNDEPDNAELIERIKSCRPMKTRIPTHAK